MRRAGEGKSKVIARTSRSGKMRPVGRKEDWVHLPRLNLCWLQRTDDWLANLLDFLFQRNKGKLLVQVEETNVFQRDRETNAWLTNTTFEKRVTNEKPNATKKYSTKL